jgi:hypothetical protein
MKVCSIGSFCQSSRLLQRLELKEESYPFDWILSNHKMVKHCIEDDFRTFLDKSQYTFIPTSAYTYKVCGHNYYSTIVDFTNENIPGAVFMHHDLAQDEKDYEYFVRCVDRFRELIKSDERKLFIYFSRNRQYSENESALIEFLEFMKFLDEHVTNYNMIFIHHSIGTLTHSVVSLNRLKFINLSASRSDGLKFAEDAHNVYLDKIIKDLIDEIRKT